MTARRELFATFAEWRRWTELEHHAIQAADWPRVHECQSAKRRLQTRIIRDTGRAREECARLGLKQADLDTEVHGVVGELIRMEAHNGEVLALQRQAAEAEGAALE